ncbi:hypothetical protein [Endozoicomonas ascidiicola]|uniref:hypothetical protein n=1 Tax=Endozoicomonas ascidiicola TaxID=1698521 RepID=UPI00082B030D|nr:hypothetical protein [Endozoicomonas ascidiicola]
MQEKLSPLEALVGMTTTGLLIGLGQILGSNEKITPRLIIGRAMSSTGLSLVAGLMLIQLPNLGLIPLIGLSALIASLGTSALERLLQHYLGIKK